MTGVSAVGLLALAGCWIQLQHSTLLSQKMQKTKSLVEVPFAVVEREHELEVAGQITRDEAQHRSIDAIQAMRYEGQNYFWINDDHPRMIMHPTKPELNGKDLTSLQDPNGKALFVEMVKAAQAAGDGYVSYDWPKPGNARPVPKLSYVKRFDAWGWIIGTGIYIEDVNQAWRESAETAGALALVCLLPLLVVSALTWRSTAVRLEHILVRVKDIAKGEGDLTKRIPPSAGDEIGELAKWFNTFLDKLQETITPIAEAAVEVGKASAQMSQISQQISANSEETSAQAGVVSSATDQVNRGLQTVASSTEEMSSSIREIAKSATEAAKIADIAMKTATETNAIVTKLGRSSAEIGQVIKVITSIAQKTDLLALNATVEAARAGDVGAGFAVVANEVKELAKQTATATEDISRKIQAIQGDAKSAVAAIASIREVIGQVNDISGTIATAVEQQSATTSEMSRNVAEAARGSSEVAQNIQGVAQAAQSTSQGATDSQRAASHLTETSGQLRELLRRFKIGRKPQPESDRDESQGKRRVATVGIG